MGFWAVLVSTVADTFGFDQQNFRSSLGAQTYQSQLSLKPPCDLWEITVRLQLSQHVLWEHAEHLAHSWPKLASAAVGRLQVPQLDGPGPQRRITGRLGPYALTTQLDSSGVRGKSRKPKSAREAKEVPRWQRVYERSPGLVGPRVAEGHGGTQALVSLFEHAEKASFCMPMLFRLCLPERRRKEVATETAHFHEASAKRSLEAFWHRSSSVVGQQGHKHICRPLRALATWLAS